MSQATRSSQGSFIATYEDDNGDTKTNWNETLKRLKPFGVRSLSPVKCPGEPTHDYRDEMEANKALKAYFNANKNHDIGNAYWFSLYDCLLSASG